MMNEEKSVGSALKSDQSKTKTIESNIMYSVLLRKVALFGTRS